MQQFAFCKPIVIYSVFFGKRRVFLVTKGKRERIRLGYWSCFWKILLFRFFGDFLCQLWSDTENTFGINIKSFGYIVFFTKIFCGSLAVFKTLYNSVLYNFSVFLCIADKGVTFSVIRFYKTLIWKNIFSCITNGINVCIGSFYPVNRCLTVKMCLRNNIGVHIFKHKIKSHIIKTVSCIVPIIKMFCGILDGIIGNIYTALGTLYCDKFTV